MSATSSATHSARPGYAPLPQEESPSPQNPYLAHVAKVQLLRDHLSAKIGEVQDRIKELEKSLPDNPNSKDPSVARMRTGLSVQKFALDELRKLDRSFREQQREAYAEVPEFKDGTQQGSTS